MTGKYKSAIQPRIPIGKGPRITFSRFYDFEHDVDRIYCDRCREELLVVDKQEERRRKSNEPPEEFRKTILSHRLHCIGRKAFNMHMNTHLQRVPIGSGNLQHAFVSGIAQYYALEDNTAKKIYETMRSIDGTIAVIEMTLKQCSDPDPLDYIFVMARLRKMDGVVNTITKLAKIVNGDAHPISDEQIRNLYDEHKDTDPDQWPAIKS